MTPWGSKLKRGPVSDRAKEADGREDAGSILFYEARSTIAGPCGHKHGTKEAAEKCARSFAAKHRRHFPQNEHTYWHVVSVDGHQVRRRVSEDF